MLEKFPDIRSFRNDPCPLPPDPAASDGSVVCVPAPIVVPEGGSVSLDEGGVGAELGPPPIAPNELYIWVRSPTGLELLDELLVSDVYGVGPVRD